MKANENLTSKSPCEPWSTHDFHDVYYGTTCRKCQLFFPAGGAPWDEPKQRENDKPDDFDPNSEWYYWDDEERDEDNHLYNCTCESCLQNHPERDILYGDGNYFEYGDEE